MITIRPYRPEDRATCDQVYFRAVREGASGFYDAEMLAHWAPEVAPADDHPDKLLDQDCWVSEDGGQITGFMSLMQDGHLDMAFVLPEVMGQGHAARLYDQLLAHAWTVGHPVLTVKASEYSRRFLSRRGWQHERVEVVTDDGPDCELNHMSLSLADPGPKA